MNHSFEWSSDVAEIVKKAKQVGCPDNVARDLEDELNALLFMSRTANRDLDFEEDETEKEFEKAFGIFHEAAQKAGQECRVDLAFLALSELFGEWSREILDDLDTNPHSE